MITPLDICNVSGKYSLRRTIGTETDERRRRSKSRWLVRRHPVHSLNQKARFLMLDRKEKRTDVLSRWPAMQSTLPLQPLIWFTQKSNPL